MIDTNKIDDLFNTLGFLKKTLPNGTVCYMKDEVHYQFTYVSGLNSYVLETADNTKEAELNRFEDNELYSFDLGEEAILKKLKEDLLQYYL